MKMNPIVHFEMPAENREKVDEMIGKAVVAGGTEYRKAQDYGWMYGRASRISTATSGRYFTWTKAPCQKKRNE